MAYELTEAEIEELEFDPDDDDEGTPPDVYDELGFTSDEIFDEEDADTVEKADFKEEEHPRASDGRFGDKAGKHSEKTEDLKDSGVVEGKGVVDWDDLHDRTVKDTHKKLKELVGDYNGKEHPEGWPKKVPALTHIRPIWGSDREGYQGFLAQIARDKRGGGGVRLEYQYGIEARLKELSEFANKRGGNWSSTARDVKSIYTHEFAHVIDGEGAPSKEFAKMKSARMRDGQFVPDEMDMERIEDKVIGDYCHANAGEYFAEYFCAYKMGLLNGTPLEKFGEWFKERGL